jgi:hypothetical protein
MNQTWIADAPERLAALEHALKQRDSNDVVISYAEAALAFPSSDLHPNTFEYPQIDNISMRDWAEEQGWNVAFEPEMAAEGQTHSFPVRLTKKDAL